MKYLIYIAILLGVMFYPAKGTDVGKLIPVEVVAISQRNETVTVRTDTGDTGRGETLQAAIDDLKATAPGIIYLDTAEYVLLEEGTEVYLDAVGRHLKQRVRLCYAAEGIPLEGMGDFLSVHKPDVTLDTVSDYGSIPIITEENRRYHLTEK